MDTTPKIAFNAMRMREGFFPEKTLSYQRAVVHETPSIFSNNIFEVAAQGLTTNKPLCLILQNDPIARVSHQQLTDDQPFSIANAH
jgi:hypothetical protein